MAKGMKKILITLAAILALGFTAVPTSAATYNVVKIDIPQTTVNMKAGQNVGLRTSISYTGTAPKSFNVTWTSSNSNVATVSGGNVKAKKAGTVKITAKVNGKTDVCTVKVSKGTSKFVSAAGCYAPLNNYRKSANAKALKKDANLENIAKIRAKEMALTGKFSHTRPNGKSGLTLIKGNIYKGENIAMGQKTCSQVTVAWYKSAGHRKNMLKKQYKKVGIAGYEYNGVIYWAQVFSS